ncbi:MAG TPA: ABC transporter permease [Anaerolineae bacterium]|nr:ABC transporter permease [Anaerolineae bacterium]
MELGGPASKSASLGRDAWARLISNKLAVAGMVVIAILLLMAILGPYITPYDFLVQDLQSRNQPPSAAYWLGTDDLGRDVLSRVVYGARTATIVAFSTTLVSLAIGITLGAIAGYSGGKKDSFIAWLIDMTMSVPTLLVAVVINMSLKAPVANWMEEMYLATKNPIFRQTVWADFALVFGALALIQWPTYARLIRGQILSIRNTNYVLAARSMGVPTPRILTRYVIPNALGPVIVSMSAGLGAAMVMESAFSFLGIGVRPPMPSWGNMISDGLRVWHLYPHLLAAPAAVLGIVTVAFSFLGDGLNDALNPRQWK